MAVSTRTVPSSAQPGLTPDPLLDPRTAPAMSGEDVPVAPAAESQRVVTATNPTYWWMAGLLALAIVIAILFALQMFNGAPGTDVQSGTPTAAPVVAAPTAP